jgi:hypothetical protein
MATVLKESQMPKLTASTGGIKIDDGVYDATLLDIEVRQATANSPNKDPFLMWTFHVYDTEEGQEMKQSTSSAFTPKTNARKWAEALIGRKYEVGEECDTDTLCPKDCQVLVSNDNDKGFAKIINVLAAKKRFGPKKPRDTEHDGIVMDDEGITL